MESCSHPRRRCLNHFDTIRKYICEECGVVHICDCDEQLAMQFLPHQTRTASEYGTRTRHPVAGFAPALCPECRGEPELPHPMASVRGRKSKIERFYWREITKTFHGLARDWLRDHGETVSSVLDFGSRFPEVSKELRKEARRYWQQRHKTDPKYDLSEPTQQELHSDLEIPEVVVFAPYQKMARGEQSVGKWDDGAGELVSAERIAARFYKAQGWEVYECERRLISTLYATFCFPVVQDPTDPELQIGYRNSTRGWTSEKPNTGLIAIPLPKDFGLPHHFDRRQAEYERLLEDLAEASLREVFEANLAAGENLRDYLWVNEDHAVHLARHALQVIPHDAILRWLRWVAGDFWHRQPGWPDLLLLREGAFRFSEVKTPNDALSQEQIRWFRWACGEEQVPCEICRVRKEPGEIPGAST
jgi:hypothetical protein